MNRIIKVWYNNLHMTKMIHSDHKPMKCQSNIKINFKGVDGKEEVFIDTGQDGNGLAKNGRIYGIKIWGCCCQEINKKRQAIMVDRSIEGWNQKGEEQSHRQEVIPQRRISNMIQPLLLYMHLKDNIQYSNVRCRWRYRLNIGIVDLPPMWKIIMDKRSADKTLEILI